MSGIKHVAIIMDGNGRWAKERRRPRFWGHVRGMATISKIVEAANSRKIKALTLYAFSSENWSRPRSEVEAIFSLLVKFSKKEKERLIKENVIFKVLGRKEEIPTFALEAILELEKATSTNSGLIFSVAFNYGGRAEIVDAANKFFEENPNQKIKEVDFSKYLYRPETGDVDLMIRTGGDQRVSNYLLWQIAYAELYFTETLWPVFEKEEFNMILDKVAIRERRFGGVGHELTLEKTTELSSKAKLR